jgi:SAM-dependent methyltransferase
MNETDKPILDACCGSRMFWKDHNNPNVLYVDNRVLKCQMIWKSHNGRSKRYCTVLPDIVADFTALPFADNTFCHVVFDPPHLVNVGERSWMAKKYGRLDRYEWPKMIRCGFAECWRVLKTNGTLVFKWNQTDIDFNTVFEVVGKYPLYGHICGKSQNTIWAVYVKLPKEEVEAKRKEGVHADA